MGGARSHLEDTLTFISAPHLQPCQVPAPTAVTGAGELSLLQTVSPHYWHFPPHQPFPWRPGDLLRSLLEASLLPSRPGGCRNAHLYTDFYRNAKVLRRSCFCQRGWTARSNGRIHEAARAQNSPEARDWVPARAPEVRIRVACSVSSTSVRGPFRGWSLRPHTWWAIRN